MALEAKGLPYQYCEVDPSKAPRPMGFAQAATVPAVRQGDWTCSESAVILEYVRLFSRPHEHQPAVESNASLFAKLEDVSADTPLFPRDPKHRAKCRLWIDHVRVIYTPHPRSCSFD
jgi:glutathione S-transferase